MPHEIHLEKQRFAIIDVVTIDRPDQRAFLRAHRTVGGEAVIVTAGDTSRDGAPLLGNLAVLAAGTGAILRAGSLRVAVVWNPVPVRRRATVANADDGNPTTQSHHCRLCFGSFIPDEIVIACACDESFHTDCDRARLDCPACGAPREEVSS